MRSASGATSQSKRYIHFDVYGAARGVEPIQESDGAAMLAAADLGKQAAFRGQGHTHQLARILAVELQLKHSAGGEFRFAFRVLPGEPQQLGDAVAQRP